MQLTSKSLPDKVPRIFSTQANTALVHPVARESVEA